MKRLVIMSLSILITGLLVSVPLYAQGGRDAKNVRQQYYRMYDFNTVETIEGTVAEVIYRSGKIAGMQGVEIKVKTSSTTIPVHLGPRWYIEQQEPVKESDRITVTGSRITFEGESVLVASKVQRGEMALQLRDQQGFPVWRGWRMNKRAN